ncbi:hypothetical protein [Streptomyces sp. SID3343]|uniref:hypothetical protein n=1 Tax=Streptomyces sp. SID3343 TaxID=2690260 RepID=UPI00136E4E1A|nr:hypothetical protein [Streptomyces sp. SID3343]MYW03092.1 hypothetical protein [Streptomyces sp. SID3343]
MSAYGDPERVDAVAAELAEAVTRVGAVPIASDWRGSAAAGFAARGQAWRLECLAAESAVGVLVAALRAHADVMRAALVAIAERERAARAIGGGEESFPAGGSAAWLDERWAVR